MMNTIQSIAKAVSLFRCSPHAQDIEVYDALVEIGVDRQIAARVVELLPMAYCRVILASKGVRFAETFRRQLSETEISGPRLLSSELLWKPCLAFASSEANSGILGKDLL